MTTSPSFQINDRIIHPLYGPGSVTYAGTTSIGLRFEKQGNMLLRYDAAGIQPWSLEAETLWLETIAAEEANKLSTETIPWPTSTFHFETAETNHCCGSHWDPFVDEPTEIFNNLPTMLEQAQLIENIGRHRTPPKDLPAEWPQGFHLVWPMQRRGLIITCCIDEHEQRTVVANVYPFWSEGTQHTFTINSVEVWESGVEAQITASLGEAEISFCDVHF